jgi:CBS domain-containing protein
MPDHKHERTELPIRIRTVHAGEGTVDRDETVLCPSRGVALSVGTCLDCHYCFGRTYAGEPALVCLHPAARRPDKPPRPLRMPSPAELTALSQIMTRNVACIVPDLGIGELGTLLLDRNISAAPVVDAYGRPIGVVSKTDLVRYYHDDGGTDATVADVMMPMAFTLTEDAPIAYAAALMAVEDVHHLPIVAGDGRVVGIISALDIVRWLAHHDGFVVPPARGD